MLDGLEFRIDWFVFWLAGLLHSCTHARFVRLPFHEPAVSSCNLALVLFVWAFMAPKRAKTKARSQVSRVREEAVQRRL